MDVARICYEVDISDKLFAIQYFLEHFQAYLEIGLGQQIWQYDFTNFYASEVQFLQF